jgi:PAS domain-containing protein
MEDIRSCFFDVLSVGALTPDITSSARPVWEGKVLNRTTDAAIREWNARRIFEACPHPYLILNRDLLIVGVNQEYTRKTLTDADVIMGRNIFDVFPANPGDPKADGEQKLLASLCGVINTRSMHRMPWLRYDIRNRSGAFVERHWSPTNTPILDANGDVEFLIHAVEDVTAIVAQSNKFLLTRDAPAGLCSAAANRSAEKKYHS